LPIKIQLCGSIILAILYAEQACSVTDVKWKQNSELVHHTYSM